MTVKELKEILSTYNDDAEVRVETGQVIYDVHDSQIFETKDGREVIIDVVFGDEE